MPFQKGQSGNPAGRKPGTKNRKLELLRSNDKRLKKKVLEMALDGDPVALRICADRLWPKLRPEAAPVRVITASSDLASQGRGNNQCGVVRQADAGRTSRLVIRIGRSGPLSRVHGNRRPYFGTRKPSTCYTLGETFKRQVTNSR